MLIAAMAGVWKSAAAVASTFSGTFSTTAATANISSSTRTYTLGAGNSGQVKFTSVVDAGTGTSYNKNGAGLVTFVENDIITLANTDTLLVRATGIPAASSTTFNLIDVSTGTTIEAVSITRT